MMAIGGGTGGKHGLDTPTFLSGGAWPPTFKFRILPE